MDKEEVVEKYQSKKIMRSLALVEKRLDELESLRENFSKGSGI